MDLKFLILVRCLSLVGPSGKTPINLIRIKWFYVVKNLENESNCCSGGSVKYGRRDMTQFLAWSLGLYLLYLPVHIYCCVAD